VVIGGGYIKFAGLRWFTRKSLGYSAKPQSQGRRPGVAVRPKPARPVWRTGLTELGSQGAGCFEVEGTRQDRKTCVEAMRSAIAGHPSDGYMKTNSQSALVGVYLSLGLRGILDISLASI
jgi:hypothetical protein